MKAKRLTAAILAGIMALSLAGCGDVDESSKSKDSSSKAAGEASSAAESSSAESSSQGQDSEPDKADGDEFELLQGLIGKKPDDARALMSERIPQAKEDDNSPLTEGDLLGYLYTGDVEIGGVSFSFMTLMADKDGKAVKSIMLVANDNPEQKVISGEEEYKNAEKTYEKLLKALTEDFGEPETRKEQGDFTMTESLWKDKQVTLKLACYKSGGEIKYPSLGLTFGSASSGDTKAAEEVKFDISKIETFEDYDAIFGAEGDKVMELLINGIADGAQGEDDEGYLNAMSKRYNKKNINFDQGKDLLGCGDVYQMNIDFDSENGDIYTIAFRKNQDLNTLEGNTPDPFECKESYEALYKLFSERYGEPQQKFTPESNNFFGALWEDTPCGEIWIAWAEKIFGSEQCDCVVSFSKRGVNTAKS
ncbi:MAG: hypothetical protein K6F91_08350 [Ruminococcus sp.]|nr:hypothetical protein [Ruminococcus sp.]